MNTIVVTGDSRGVGLSITKTLLTQGYKVIGISRSTTNDNKVLKENFADKYIVLNFDLSNTGQIKKLYKNELKPHGPIYGMVNNAAFAYDDIITNLNSEPLQQMFQINVFSPMMLTKYVLRDMLLHKTQGSIIHISSISVYTGYKGLAMYASSKGAIEAFSKNTAREWGGLGIRSNVICPGFMDTAMSSTLSEDQKNRIFNRNSLKKPVEVIDVSETVKFLLSKSSKGITGEVIHVDNGTI